MEEREAKEAKVQEKQEEQKKINKKSKEMAVVEQIVMKKDDWDVGESVVAVWTSSGHNASL